MKPIYYLLTLFLVGNMCLKSYAQELSAVNKIRTQTIDVKHIAIDLHFDWQKKQALGTAKITLSPLQKSDKIALDAGRLSINTLTLANGKALKFSYDGSDKNDGLLIQLDRSYEVGEDLTIHIDYHTNWINETDPNNIWGSNGKGIRFFEPTPVEPKRRKQIWSMGEPESNSYWFPCYDSPNDLRSTEFSATVEKPLMAIANGILVEVKDNKDGTQTFHWQMDTPYSNSQTSFVIGEYVDIQQTYLDISLHNYGYPDEKEGVAASVVRLPDMIKYFSEYTDIKYPYPTYSQVFVQELPGWVGYASAATITENMVDDFGTHADFYYLWDITEGEALAYQWFGNYVSCQDWRDIWLSKSFAHYFGELYNEQKNGRSEYLLYQHLFDHNTYLNDWQSGLKQPIVNPNYENPTAYINDNYTNLHGASVLHILRKYLGEEKWKKVIQLYLKNNAHKLVTTADFQAVVEAVSGEDMDVFFEQWVYKIGHPIFELEKKYDAATQMLTLVVKQVQKRDSASLYPQTDFFKGKVAIEIDEKIEEVNLEAKAENVFTFKLLKAPKLVNFDYESTWIKEIRFEKPLEELLYQFQYDKDILGQNWAMGELIQLAKNEKTTQTDKERIYAGFRSVIAGNSYWRLRVNATVQLRNLLIAENAATPFDATTIELLLNLIKKEQSWLRATAINSLGMTKDAKYADIYIRAFQDKSDRVVNAAANALGKSKSPKAFKALVKLKDKPSWKNQSLISTLNGLKELGDTRGFEVAYKALSDLNLARWTLATPVWDFRIAAVETIVALGKKEAAYPLLLERFEKAMAIHDINAIFNNVLLITTLADPRGKAIFEPLKAKFKDDSNAMTTINQYETQFNEAIKP